ncbi:MAG: nuclear transport factor 2 family protein [Brevundimonas sp.]
MGFRAVLIAGMLLMGMVSAGPAGAQSAEDDRRAVAALDLEYQAAVKRNDFAVMDRILHPDFVLVTGNGRVFDREALFESERVTTYEQQDETPGSQMVHLYGDTAVVTARLWIKGTGPTGSFDRTLWFSDTYVRTESGWKYAFAQASLALPPEQAASAP